MKSQTTKKIEQLQKVVRDRREWAKSHQAQTGSEGYAPVFESLMNKAKTAMKRAKNVEKRIELMIEKEEAETSKEGGIACEEAGTPPAP